ncbi:hypothetical protein E2C01_041633 [Portunus trituberculatus]|uniref:Uncharacterized protein n=1 Tax=Portunus trituberculatus TaxID=210409 RepID=A0A5B7FU85_PORTR|nr:hypothetical protein [Portunus trituberculatus]
MPSKKMAITLPLKKAVTRRAERATKKSEKEPASDSDKQSIASSLAVAAAAPPDAMDVSVPDLPGCSRSSTTVPRTITAGPVIAMVGPRLTPDHTLSRIMPVRPGGF